MIKAKTYSDDHKAIANFDATKWFEQASDKEILKLANCGWGGDYPADNVAIFMADHDDKVADVFKYIEIAKTQANGDTMGFECHVDEDDARKWLTEHNPALLSKLDEDD